MSIQTASLGDLEKAENIVVAQCLFTAEHNAPCPALVTHYTLGKGQYKLTVPKVGQATARELTDGVDMVDTQDIDLTYEEAEPNEIGLKFILTDKLVRQFNEDVFRVIGQQMGDAMGRKRDKDVITLFAGLNNTWGLDQTTITASKAHAFCTLAVTYKFPGKLSCVLHPNTLGVLSKAMAAVASTYYAGIIPGPHAELLRNFWVLNLNGVNFYHDGNIEKYSTTDSGYGAIFAKVAMGVVESKAPATERQRDASLRAWEVVTVTDYKAFEVDGRYGGRLQYEMGDSGTT